MRNKKIWKSIGILLLILILLSGFTIYFKQEQDNKDPDYYPASSDNIKFLFQNGEGNWELLERGEEGQNEWFIRNALNDAAADLAIIEGISIDDALQRFSTNGYSIYTTIDPSLQSIAEEMYKNYEDLDPVFKQDNSIQSGITIMDPYTGYIVASVGGIERLNDDHAKNYTKEKRTPGTVLSPLTVYAPAIDEGLIEPNTEIVVKQNESEVSVLAGKGLQMSNREVTTEIIKMLGSEKAFDFATQNLGLTLDDVDKSQEALATGELQNGVSTEDLVAAYAAFANGGVYNKPRSYLWIKDANNRIILENAAEEQRAMKETTAGLMTDILEGTVISGTGVSAHFDNMSIAGVTGSTEHNFDRWFVGYTPYYVAAAWVGKDDNTAISSSSNPACSVWKKIMEQVHNSLPQTDFDIENMTLK